MRILNRDVLRAEIAERLIAEIIRGFLRYLKSSTAHRNIQKAFTLTMIVRFIFIARIRRMLFECLLRIIIENQAIVFEGGVVIAWIYNLI